MNASNDKSVLLPSETDKDETLVALKNHIIKGWLSQKGKYPSNLTEYQNYRDELSILDVLILEAIRIIVPNQCREELLEKLHFSIDRTKLRAMDSIVWLGIN